MAAATFDIDDLDAGEALEALQNAIGVNPSPRDEPEVLDLKELHTLERVFQPRDLSFREGDHATHVDTLAKAIGKPEKPRYLDPITVWWAGDRWCILDGHHRRLAYERTKVGKNIPVRVFKGTLEEAFAHSVSLNSKDKLPMSARDKTNMAWRLTAYTDFSKSRVATECAVAERTVANMRQVKRQLVDLGSTVGRMLELTWPQAQLEAKGELRPEIDQDAAIEKRAKGYARSLAKALGNRPHKDPEGFARALQMLDERLPASLLETRAWADALSGYLRDTDESLGGNSDY